MEEIILELGLGEGVWGNDVAYLILLFGMRGGGFFKIE